MVTEKSQEKRLNDYKINIKTKYKSDTGVLERNTDNSKNDNIIDGIILEKDYYYNGQVIKKENIFDSRILYTYEFNSDKKIVCSNCGMEGFVKDFKNGCSYCHTSYNIDFSNKSLGSKYYYDLVVKDKKYIIKTLVIDVIISLIITLIYILNTSRTFYFFDGLKVIGGTILVSLILFYFFYYLDAAIIIPSVRNTKEKLNRKQQEFWKRMIQLGVDKTKFYNNLHYDLRKLYYGDKYKEIIDYDIIDYNYFEDEIVNENLFVIVNLDIRLVKFIDGKIISKIENKTYKLKRVTIDKELNGEINHIRCHNCGASIDVMKESCDYCGTKFNYLQEWYLIEES